MEDTIKLPEKIDDKDICSNRLFWWLKYGKKLKK